MTFSPGPGADAVPTIRLLLVEDDPDQQALAQVQLQSSPQHRFEVTPAGSLREALERLGAGRFDLIMLDLYLPDSRGVDTFRYVHELAAQTPVVIVSASTDRDAALAAIRSGGQDYLVKGEFGTRDLIRALVFAFERTRLLRELAEARREAQALRSILPVCAGCKKVRDEAGTWRPLEAYLDKESGVRVSHGLCPDCERRYSP